MIIYNKKTGDIIADVPKEQNLQLFVSNYSEEIQNNVASLEISNVPYDLENYRIIDGKLTRLSNKEIEEKRLYGKILSEEERLLEKLKPSLEEIRKAEQTIEILTLLQEVM